MQSHRLLAALAALAVTSPSYAGDLEKECSVSAECGALRCINGRCRSAEDVVAASERRRRAAFDPVVKRYAGMSIAPFGGFGFEGRNVTALGADVFVGVRLFRWLSVESFYAIDFEIGHSPFPPAGAECLPSPGRSWTGDWFRWQVVGVRTWFHAVHTRAFDLSFAPMIAGGFAIDHVAACAGRDLVTTSPEFETGITLGAEVRFAPWLGLRLTAEGIVAVDVVIFAARAAFGPVIRF